jgi:hypothetical protein
VANRNVAFGKKPDPNSGDFQIWDLTAISSLELAKEDLLFCPAALVWDQAMGIVSPGI